MTERDHLEDRGRDWRIVLKLILQNMMGEERELDLSGSGQGQVVGSSECCNELRFP